MKSGMPLSIRARSVLEGYAFVSVWLGGFVLFLAYPLIRSLIFSFNRYRVGNEGLEGTYVGLHHYRNALAVDTVYVPNIVSTIVKLAVQTPIVIIFSIFCALLLNLPIKGRATFRSIFFLPVIVASGEVLGRLIGSGANLMPFFLNSDFESYLVQYVPPHVLYPIFDLAEELTLVMWDAGIPIIIFLAGLQSIPASLYEAAKCDGATPWEAFWKVTFPMIAPMILVSSLYAVVHSFTKPGNPVMEQIRATAFKSSDYGYASAMGWIYFVVIFAVIGLIMLVMKRSVESTDERRG